MSNTQHPIQNRYMRFAVNSILPLSFVGTVLQLLGVAG